ncbi:hypothetical protein ELI30_27800 (plasmid) [Rhizobium leguminosarum]|uniref:hypothetical protein n=1 Tax=Rhizobium TaxID=379 RepID=UPI001030B423|nr:MULTISPECIES: hypothetical protein [Rhizobium]TAV45451.1 hypothetical protein ELI31_26720 [Rhizobium leguminosarum]TAV46008.1 hypothetical protein ELI32_28030 [Rhizobium leguminosarum]TAV63863.1 hypothetical protein ELI30_27800 [Rhizobium leguminosarum]TAX05512.1 hypothetical protein ELI07_24895 [Rhizobium leguminosarum]TAX87626.1 hypothetical protein ELH97_24615 [Rhizobium leguminosarum]
MTKHTSMIQAAASATSHTPHRELANAAYCDVIMPFIEKSRVNLAKELVEYDQEAKCILTSFVMQYASAKRPSPNSLHAECVQAFAEKNEERAASGLSPLEVPKHGRFRRFIHALDDMHCMMARHGIKLAASHARFITSLHDQPPQMLKALQVLADVGSDVTANFTNGMVTGIGPKA